MCGILQGMYGLPQEGMIANKILTEILTNNGYCPCELTPGQWKHEKILVTFCSTVNKLGVKYVYK